MFLSRVVLFFVIPATVFGFDVEAKEKTARALVQISGHSLRFKEEQMSLMKSMREAKLAVSEDYMKAFDETLAKEDFEGALARVVIAYFPADDLEKAVAFFSDGAGKKEMAFTLELYAKLKAKTVEITEIPLKRERFYATLTPKERQEIVTFQDSPAGQRYWDSYAKIGHEIGPIFDRLCLRAHEKMKMTFRE